MGRRPIPPPTYFLMALLAMVALHRVVPIMSFGPPALSVVGVAVVAGGVAMVLWSARLFARRGTTIKPFQESSHLVANGPYTVTRNPMYVGMVAILAGIWLMLSTLAPVVVIPLFVWLLTDRFIIPEERMLAERFGHQYREYTQRVRRWL